MLFRGKGIGFSDKSMLHCFKEVKCQRVILQEFSIRYILL